MFLGPHLAAGLIIGKLTGNYVPAIIGATFLDFDHLVPYAKYKALASIKNFWKAITDKEDKFGHQRNFLHNLFILPIISIIIMLINFKFGLVLSYGFLSHIFLDMIDNADLYPFYPFKINLKGPIDFFSHGEIVLSIIMFVCFLIL